MIIASVVKVTNLKDNEIWFRTYLHETSLKIVKTYNNNWFAEIVKDATLPVYSIQNCYDCVSLSDIKKLISQELHDAVRKWMYGQTIPIIPNFEDDLIYEHDWKNFLSGGKVFWD